MLIRYRLGGLTSTDLLIDAYPKSGSTWLRFVLASALAGRDMDFDLVREYSPGLDCYGAAPELLPHRGRMIASHERHRALAPGKRPLVLYLVRDGRDVAVSYYHHLNRKGSFPSDFQSFVDPFLAGRVGPYGTWQRHVLSWRKAARAHPQTMMVVRYEDLLADPVGCLLTVNQRLRLGLEEHQIVAAVGANTPERMRAKEGTSKRLRAANVSGTPFVRTAQPGQWQATFDGASVARFEQVARQGLLAFGYRLETDPRGPRRGER